MFGFLQLSETQLEDALHFRSAYVAAASAAGQTRIAAIRQAVTALEQDPLDDGCRLNDSYLAASAALKVLEGSLREQRSVEAKVSPDACSARREASLLLVLSLLSRQLHKAYLSGMCQCELAVAPVHSAHQPDTDWTHLHAGLLWSPSHLQGPNGLRNCSAAFALIWHGAATSIMCSHG